MSHKQFLSLSMACLYCNSTYTAMQKRKNYTMRSSLSLCLIKPLSCATSGRRVKPLAERATQNYNIKRFYSRVTFAHLSHIRNALAISIGVAISIPIAECSFFFSLVVHFHTLRVLKENYVPESTLTYLKRSLVANWLFACFTLFAILLSPALSYSILFCSVQLYLVL